jgi:hypothetical protein
MIPSHCRRRGLGRASPVALSLVLLVAGCSPPASAPSEVARPVKTMVVASGGETHMRTFPR